MSKDKKVGGVPGDEANRPESVATKEANYPAVAPTVSVPQASQAAPLPPLVNGAPEFAPKAPPVRRTWSTPLQGMARIEAVMNDLTERQQAIVFAWFAATYCPPDSSFKVSTEAMK